MTRVAIHGAGRMARQVTECLPGYSMTLQAMVAKKRPEWLPEGVRLCSLDELEPLPDLLIDFTLPGGTRAAAEWCRARLVPLVSGVTGLGEDDRQALRDAAELVPVLWASNLSKGINLALRQVAETAATLGDRVAVEILDIHHVYKKDAPSGTALSFASAIAAAWGVTRDERLDIAGDRPVQPKAGRILCVSQREGDIIGQHRVRFLMGHEVLETTHAASDRDIFARGALEAGRWLVAQPAGLYSAADWLQS